MAMNQADISTELWCDGCGRLVLVRAPQQVWSVYRQRPTSHANWQALNPDGRVTMQAANGETVHQCAEGEYVPTGQIATRRVGH